MGVSSFTLVRPSAFLCTCLVVLMFCFPESCLTGKKGLPSVKHLFGVGLGYQRVVQYKPVLVISKHRRVKQQQQQHPGWGWNSGGKGYAPIHIQQHVHKHGKSGPSYGHPPPHRHRRKRKRPPHLFSSLSTGSSSGRGWGWRQSWRRPHRSYRKGHGSGRNHGHGADGGHSGYDSPVSQHLTGDHDYHHSTPHHEISEHSSPLHSDHGSVWGASVGSGGAFYPSQSSTYFGSPYSSIDDTEDDHGGYESEVRENWNKDVSTTADVPPSSTPTPSPRPPHYPFVDYSKNDGSVTSMNRDFLKTHMKNFRQFQHYQQATTHQPSQDQDENQFAPLMLKAPGPYFSTMDAHSSEAEERGNAHDDDEYRDEDARGGSTEGFDEDYTSNFNELSKKMITLPQDSTQNSVFQTTTQPTTSTAVVKSNSNFHQVVTTMPKNNKKFKPSPRIDELGSGNSFNKPGFFPTFEQFKQINME